MAPTEHLRKVNIGEQATQLTEAFTMMDLVQIDDLALSVFLCQGSLPFHRHVDQDELFLVHSGTITVESEWGTVVLRPGEMTVAPKGVGHRSSSLLHSLVLLLQPRLMVNRRNGDRRLFSVKATGKLEKVTVAAVGRQIATPFRPVTLADVDTFALQLTLCRGTGPWWIHERQNSLVLCHEGGLMVEHESGQLTLERGELVVVPPRTLYRLSSPDRALVLGVKRHRGPLTG